MGLFSAPNPADWIVSIKDDNLKRAAVETGISIAYSQYITFLYSFGNALQGKRFIGFLGGVFINMAASAFKLLQLQNTEKLIYLSVPTALIEDTKLLNSIWWEKEQSK
jgi:hypothetical protein